MRIVLLFSLVFIPVATLAQTPPPSTPAAQPRTPRPAARTAMVITVTDPMGATLQGVLVEASGVADRSGETDESGTLRFANLKAGTYRLRFNGSGFIPFEREVNVRSGQTADVDVMLNPDMDDEESGAEPEPVAAEVPCDTAVGPPGEPKTELILTLLDKEIIRKEPRKETPLGCSGNARSTLIQVNDQQPERLYETAEAIYYVIGGEGTVRLNGRESAITASAYVQVPRGTSHAFVRKGKRPLIVLGLLSGEPCRNQ